jgi:hypothetical protein
MLFLLENSLNCSVAGYREPTKNLVSALILSHRPSQPRSTVQFIRLAVLHSAEAETNNISAGPAFFSFFYFVSQRVHDCTFADNILGKI